MRMCRSPSNLATLSPLVECQVVGACDRPEIGFVTFCLLETLAGDDPAAELPQFRTRLPGVRAACRPARTTSLHGWAIRGPARPVADTANASSRYGSKSGARQPAAKGSMSRRPIQTRGQTTVSGAAMPPGRKPTVRYSTAPTENSQDLAMTSLGVCRPSDAPRIARMGTDWAKKETKEEGNADHR